METTFLSNYEGLFSGLKNLYSLPDISKWDTQQVLLMNNMFSFLNVEYLPDISKWNTSKVEDMAFMFCGCA